MKALKYVGLLAILPLLTVALTGYVGEADAIARDGIRHDNIVLSEPDADVSLSLKVLREPTMTKNVPIKGVKWNNPEQHDDTPTFMTTYLVSNEGKDKVLNIDILVKSDVETVSGIVARLKVSVTGASGGVPYVDDTTHADLTFSTGDIQTLIFVYPVLTSTKSGFRDVVLEILDGTEVLAKGFWNRLYEVSSNGNGTDGIGGIDMAQMMEMMIVVMMMTMMMTMMDSTTSQY